MIDRRLHVVASFLFALLVCVSLPADALTADELKTKLDASVASNALDLTSVSEVYTSFSAENFILPGIKNPSIAQEGSYVFVSGTLDGFGLSSSPALFIADMSNQENPGYILTVKLPGQYEIDKFYSSAGTPPDETSRQMLSELAPAFSDGLLVIANRTYTLDISQVPSSSARDQLRLLANRSMFLSPGYNLAAAFKTQGSAFGVILGLFEGARSEALLYGKLGKTLGGLALTLPLDGVLFGEGRLPGIKADGQQPIQALLNLKGVSRSVGVEVDVPFKVGADANHVFKLNIDYKVLKVDAMSGNLPKVNEPVLMVSTREAGRLQIPGVDWLVFDDLMLGGYFVMSEPPRFGLDLDAKFEVGNQSFEIGAAVPADGDIAAAAFKGSATRLAFNDIVLQFEKILHARQRREGGISNADIDRAISGATSTLPISHLRLENFDIEIAMMDQPAIDVQAGVCLHGSLFAEDRQILDLKNFNLHKFGVTCSGVISPIKLGEVLQIKGGHGKDSPIIDFALTLGDQHFKFFGEVDLLGNNGVAIEALFNPQFVLDCDMKLLEQDLDVRISSDPSRIDILNVRAKFTPGSLFNIVDDSLQTVDAAFQALDAGTNYAANSLLPAWREKSRLYGVQMEEECAAARANKRLAIRRYDDALGQVRRLEDDVNGIKYFMNYIVTNQRWWDYWRLPALAEELVGTEAAEKSAEGVLDGLRGLAEVTDPCAIDPKMIALGALKSSADRIVADIEGIRNVTHGLATAMDRIRQQADAIREAQKNGRANAAFNIKDIVFEMDFGSFKMISPGGGSSCVVDVTVDATVNGKDGTYSVPFDILNPASGVFELTKTLLSSEGHAALSHLEMKGNHVVFDPIHEAAEEHIQLSLQMERMLQEDDLWKIGSDRVTGGNWHHWEGTDWKDYGPGAYRFDISESKRFWFITDDGDIWSCDYMKPGRGSYGKATDIAVGPDTSVWLITRNHWEGGYGGWSVAERVGDGWKDPAAPILGVRVSVDELGRPFVLDYWGNVHYRDTDMAWKRLPRIPTGNRPRYYKIAFRRTDGSGWMNNFEDQSKQGFVVGEPNFNEHSLFSLVLLSDGDLGSGSKFGILTKNNSWLTTSFMQSPTRTEDCVFINDHTSPNQYTFVLPNQIYAKDAVQLQAWRYDVTFPYEYCVWNIPQYASVGDIACGPGGDIWVCALTYGGIGDEGEDYELYRWDGTQWRHYPGTGFANITALSSGGVAGSRANGEVYAMEVLPGGGAADSSIVWRRLPGAARDVTAGGDYRIRANSVAHPARLAPVLAAESMSGDPARQAEYRTHVSGDATRSDFSGTRANLTETAAIRNKEYMDNARNIPPERRAPIQGGGR